jgi:hypothetical protein
MLSYKEVPIIGPSPSHLGGHKEQISSRSFTAGQGTWERKAVKASLDKLNRPNRLDATEYNSLDSPRQVPIKHVVR